MIGYILFEDFTPGTITNFYNSKRIYFNVQIIFMKNCSLHPAELVQLLKGAKSLQVFDSTLTEPLLYSKIWPLLRHCNQICIHIENLIYDDKMPEMLAKTTWPKPSQELFLCYFDVCKDKVLPVVTHFLNAQGEPYYQFVFKKGYFRSSFETMVGIIEERLKTAGLIVDKSFAPTCCEDSIGLIKTSATDVSLKYSQG